ncbi:isoprenylcysteine carboxylmethyltransferase family protein [Thermococcus sp. CX2]|uniref:isoprenylcysteine carboxylmethyltransferase family protein n=1 Tax=Thermococcus sp. CX2 TaxID=163006 RepID=UPI001F0F2B0E|nr:isoprenylcysteine carboxylmethyltransferase family protein [Thermococcus sp. CX2]
MSFRGIAPRVGKIVLSYAALALFLDFHLNLLTFKCYAVGLAAFLVGISLWLLRYSQIKRAYETEKLLTSGCYSRVRHPIYSIWGFLYRSGIFADACGTSPLQFIYHIGSR